MKHEEIRQKPGIREYNRRKNKEKGKKKNTEAWEERNWKIKIEHMRWQIEEIN